MLTIMICVGSSCHIRGSDELAEKLEGLIAAHQLEDEVELTGTFCMEKCSMGVSVRVGEHLFWGLCPEDADRFFNQEILPLVSPR